jgi:hypothetical protein
MKIVTVSERPDLTERAFELTFDTLREYNQHGDVLNRYWGLIAHNAIVRPSRPKLTAPSSLGGCSTQKSRCCHPKDLQPAQTQGDLQPILG